MPKYITGEDIILLYIDTILHDVNEEVVLPMNSLIISLPCMIVCLEIWLTNEISLSSLNIQQPVENGLLDKKDDYNSNFSFLCHPS